MLRTTVQLGLLYNISGMLLHYFTTYNVAAVVDYCIYYIYNAIILISDINWNRPTAALWGCRLNHTLLRASYMITKQHAVALNAVHAAT